MNRLNPPALADVAMPHTSDPAITAPQIRFAISNTSVSAGLGKQRGWVHPSHLAVSLDRKGSRAKADRRGVAHMRFHQPNGP
jgi:hypothetical protein